MKLSDYVAKFLAENNINYVFGVTGGAVVHLFDSIARNKKLTYICSQHEQAAAMAADGFFRTKGKMAAAIATSGPGATNLITGVCNAYFDSVPMFCITGQVATFRLKRDLKVRQIGFQETDVVPMFKPVTKYAVLVDDPERIRFELEKALYLSKTGRPGPVLVDISDDIQRAEIHPSKLKPFKIPIRKNKKADIKIKIEKTVKLINKARRPVFIIGSGVKLGNAKKQLDEFLSLVKFPYVLTWAALDMYDSKNRLNAGSFGITGTRYGNFTVQNSDLVIALGTRLDTHLTATPASTFARGAKKIMVDIDQHEIDKFKNSGMKIDVGVCADAKEFLLKLLKQKEKISTQDISSWVYKVNEYKKKYSAYYASCFKEKEKLNAYTFLYNLSEKLSRKDIVIADTGGNLAQTMQGLQIKKGQTVFSAFSNAPMGYSISASVGACFANNKKRVICITGDGGIQMNIQELETIYKHKLPVKIFVFNNKGYGMIQQTQDDWLKKRYVASLGKKDLGTPDFVKIAKAYGVDAVRISGKKEMDKKLDFIIKSRKPQLCELELDENQRTVPMLKFGRPIEDTNPLLERKEFFENMIVKPVKESLKRR